MHNEAAAKATKALVVLIVVLVGLVEASDRATGTRSLGADMY
jgi:hypothetical protein